MGTFFKGKSDFVNQSLTKRWTDLIKNSNFINAITGVSNSKHFMPVLNEYPIQDKNKAGQMFIYRGRIWHYMTKDQINDAGWSDIVTEGFPAPLDKVNDVLLIMPNYNKFTLSSFNTVPELWYPDTVAEVEIDSLGFGKPNLLTSYRIGYAYVPNNLTIKKIRNVNFLVNLVDVGTNNAVHFGNFDLTFDAINSFVNDIPSTNNIATINLYDMVNVTPDHVNALTDKGYIVIT